MDGVPANRPRRLRPHLLAAGALLALTLAMFGDVLLADGNVVLSLARADGDRQFVAWRAFGFGELGRGNLALWNPHILGGAPYFGGVQSALLYPLNALFLVLPVGRAINVSVALHVLLLGFTVYLFASHRGARPLGAFVAGALAAFGGAYFAHLEPGHLPNLCSAAWVPLVFLAIDGLARRPGVGYVMLGAAALALVLYAGHPQYVFLTGIAGGLLALFELRKASRRAAFIGGLAGMVALGAALAAIQLLPCLEEIPNTLRGGAGLGRTLSGEYSMPPENLLCFLAPGWLGGDARAPYHGRWFLWESQPFLGVAGLFLAVYGAALGRRDVTRSAAIVALLCLVLALGQYTPAFRLTFGALPGLSSFRSHGRFLFPASVFLALLAAAGTDELRGDGRGRRAAGIGLAALALSLAAGALLARGTGLFEGLLAAIHRAPGSFGAHLLEEPGAPAAATGRAAVSLLVAAGTAAVVAALVLLTKRTRWAALALVALAVAEPFAFSRWANRPTFDLRKPGLPGLREFLAGQTGEERTLNTMVPDLAMVTGAHDVWGYDSFVLRRWIELVYHLQGLDPDEAGSFQYEEITRPHRLLSMLRCRYLLEPGRDAVKVLRSTYRPMPRFRLTGGYRVANGRDEVFHALDEEDFDPRRTVVLEREPNVKPSGAEEDLGLVRASDETTDGVTIEAFMAEPAILLITDSYSPLWRATPLGSSPQASYEVMPANWALRAIPLAAGRHRFRLEYRPALFATGKWITLASLLLFAALAVVAVRREPRARKGMSAQHRGPRRARPARSGDAGRDAAAGRV